MIDRLLANPAISEQRDLDARRFILPIISVIIPTLNEANHIEGCLRSLLMLTIPRYLLEVIIVDSGSTDMTIKLASNFKTRLDLTILQRDGRRISMLRNHGVLHSCGDILAFLDADCLATSGWLPDHDALAVRLKDVGILGAPYEIPEDSTWIARAWDKPRKQKSDRVRYVPAGGMLMHRDVFNAVGGFDGSLETNEDVELCGRVLALGKPVIADRTVAVVHLGASQTLQQFYKRQRWHGADVFKVFLRSPGTSGNEKVVLLAAYCLLLEIAVLGTLIAGLVFGSWRPLPFCSALWLAPAILLALRRGWSSHSMSSVPALTLLNMLYATARAHALISGIQKKWRTTQKSPSKNEG